MPLVTDGRSQEEEGKLVLSNEVANARFMVGGTAYRRSGKKCSSFPESERGCSQHSTLERCKKDAWKFGVCLNEFSLRNRAQAANDARAAWSEIVTHNSGANPNVNYELDRKSFDLLAVDVRVACLKQLFSYARMTHGNGRVLRMGVAATF